MYGLIKLRRMVNAELPAVTNPFTMPRCFLKYSPKTVRDGLYAREAPVPNIRP